MENNVWESVDQSIDPYYFVNFMDEVRNFQEDDPSYFYFATNYLSVIEDGVIIDLGCGTGGALRALSNVVSDQSHLVGVDLSKIMVEEAKKRSSKTSIPITYTQANARKLPFSSNTFDACISIGLFDIVNQPEVVLSEISRVTKKGGRIVVTAPDLDAMIIDSDDVDLTRRIIHFYSDTLENGLIGRKISGMLKNVGLNVVNSEGYLTIVEEFSLVYKFWLRDVLENAVYSNVISKVEKIAWIQEMKMRQRTSRFFASFITFVFVAEKKEK